MCFACILRCLFVRVLWFWCHHLLLFWCVFSLPSQKKVIFWPFNAKLFYWWRLFVFGFSFIFRCLLLLLVILWWRDFWMFFARRWCKVRFLWREWVFLWEKYQCVFAFHEDEQTILPCRYIRTRNGNITAHFCVCNKSKAIFKCWYVNDVFLFFGWDVDHHQILYL